MEFLRRAFEEIGPSCATYGDDTEKFGLWPGTYDWVIKKGWLRRFIEEVLKASDWLTTNGRGIFLKIIRRNRPGLSAHRPPMRRCSPGPCPPIPPWRWSA